jgi:carboxyl-terminal processing protease
MRDRQRGMACRLFSLVVVAGLSACGGGGGGSSTASDNVAPPPPPPTSVYPPSSTLANVCTVEGEKKFVRSYLDEKYLWYREIPTVDASLYTDVVKYFKALLVTTPDANNLPKDQFSFAIPIADADSVSTGVNVGYGIEWARDAQSRLRVAQIMPGSPAADAGMARGGYMAGVIDYNVNSWYPNKAGAFVQFNYSDTPAATPRVIRLDARTVQDESVPLTSTVTSPGGKRAGYIAFSAHSQGAQDKLIAAARTLQSNGIRELVLDMRYNSGGYLYIASTLAAMVTGPQADGKVFEALRFNDKRAAESANNTYRFANKVEYGETTYPAGHALPRLNLKRVYVLTSADTCSASESVINSLRGVDVDVVLIGKSTCGKPYGFTRKNNCALSYYPIEFQGTNHKGFGDYSAGFAPTCSGSDDLDHALGQSQEGLLSSALYHLDRGSCAPVTAVKQSLVTRSPEQSNPLSTERLQGGRLLRPVSP